MRSNIAILFGLLVLVACLSCSDDDKPTTNLNPPFPHTLIPVETMMMDVTDLSSETAPAKSGACHFLSASIVTWVNANVMVRTALPALAIASCLANESDYIDYIVWEWGTSGGSGEDAWTATLTGTVAGPDSLYWAMQIDGTSQDFTDFLWFEGISNFTATAGSWSYFDPDSPNEPSVLILSNWAVELGTENKLVNFINVDHLDDGFQDTLTYLISENQASVSFLDFSAQGTTTVAWDLETGAGTTTSMAGESCCWGDRPTFDDVDCP